MGCCLFGNSIQTTQGIESWNLQSFQMCAATCVRIQIDKYVQLHLNAFKIALMLLFLWVLAYKYTCKYLPSVYYAPRTVLSSGERN